MGCGATDTGSQLRAQQQQQQQLTEQAVSNINSAFAGFTPQFYQGATSAYRNWAVPQLQQQYQQTQNQLQAKLANQGLGKSSIAQDLSNQLQTAQQQAQEQIASQGLSQSQQLQQQVAQEKSNLIGQAQSATDPLAVSKQATAAAGSLQLPSSFQPLGNLFQNFSNLYLGQQLANTYNPAYLSLLGYGYSNPGLGAGGSFLPISANYR